jgi:hypothetical protein
MGTSVSPCSKGPLFKVQVILNSPEIVVQPPLKEVTKFLVQLSRNLVECASPFVRWMHGRGSHSSTFQLNVSPFCGIRWVHDFPPVY